MQKYSSMRTELNGGNLRTAFRSPSNSEGIYLVDPLSNISNSGKTKQPLKLLSVEGLKKALSDGSKVTTNTHSQGLRFLAAVTRNHLLQLRIHPESSETIKWM
ncbi:uncharacterized protein LOC125480681 [Pyrus x bretschneideri]|uniref:uncharacterized protein LOC125480681 n=1 Tax=Pyrus x bretschneideri TaxID=225117 RepID=UPI00202DFC58|nr:uncharacterized protein LOC125480681 [Pyrus x bretschneideri]